MEHGVAALVECLLELVGGGEEHPDHLAKLGEHRRGAADVGLDASGTVLRGGLGEMGGVDGVTPGGEVAAVGGHTHRQR